MSYAAILEELLGKMPEEINSPQSKAAMSEQMMDFYAVVQEEMTEHAVATPSEMLRLELMGRGFANAALATSGSGVHGVMALLMGVTAGATVIMHGSPQFRGELMEKLDELGLVVIKTADDDAGKIPKNDLEVISAIMGAMTHVVTRVLMSRYINDDGEMELPGHESVVAENEAVIGAEKSVTKDDVLARLKKMLSN